MERQANYVLVGVIGVALIISAWSSSSGWRSSSSTRSTTNIGSISTGRCSGLSTGRRSPVQRHQGRRDHPHRARRNRPQPGDRRHRGRVRHAGARGLDRQTVEQGITGVKYVQISRRHAQLAVVAQGEPAKAAGDRARAGRMDDLIKDAARIDGGWRRCARTSQQAAF